MMKKRVEPLIIMLTKVWCVLSVAVMTWGVLSYLEIVSKNLCPNPAYSSYNLIIMIVNYFG